MEQEIASKLRKYSDQEKAVSMKKYLKDQFEFLGIQKPLRNEIEKEIFNSMDKKAPIDKKLVEFLWNQQCREFQYIGMDYLIKKKKQLEKDDIGLLYQMIVNKSWWDTVDLIASNLVGELCLKYPEIITDYIIPWSKSDNIWLKRTSLLFQLKYKEKTDLELLKSIILLNMDEEDFFIRKAIGWILREYSKTNKEWVKDFLNTYELSPLSIKEASKYL